ncbi:PfkB domain protein [Beutenbergia cavernae DSM 12333]|uniref:PfkB domain protein n=1 Tax=Beutenbergia cavernae (strain ATCC BAA-8 / DSM 12333 / CCUG 43141 / JCM 11478 / NBRC 16432 / NCIMB 13614 / HKI 0122) TaxID=471853 RepID=C5C6E4_BEUC1|nr:PfkB domain protein [Beutenbergia cavernae DSM 12333]
MRGLFVGLATLDVVHRVAARPGPDEKVVATRTDVAAGGPAAVAAATFAALGGMATLVTAIGRGPIGRALTHDLDACGVVVVDLAVQEEAAAPSSAVVVEHTGERSVVSSAASAPAPRPLPPEEADRMVAAADVVLLDGHHPALALPVVSAAGRHAVPVVLDGGSHKPLVDELLPLVGAAVFSGTFRFPGGGAPDGATTALGPAFVAVTQGARPVRWWTADGAGDVPVPAVDVVDTLGAGDAFHGAFAYATACGAGPIDAVRTAIAVAGVRVSHLGPRGWLTDPRLKHIAAGAGRRS